MVQPAICCNPPIKLPAKLLLQVAVQQGVSEAFPQWVMSNGNTPNISYRDIMIEPAIWGYNWIDIRDITGSYWNKKWDRYKYAWMTIRTAK